jgi:hypothetical protein
LGLLLALRALAETTAARAALQLECNLPESLPKLPPDVEQGLYRIAQEAIQNIVRHANDRIQPYRMDIAALEANYQRSRPPTISDRANLKKLLVRPELRDVRPVIEHLLKRGVKLEQEGVENV